MNTPLIDAAVYGDAIKSTYLPKRYESVRDWLEGTETTNLVGFKDFGGFLRDALDAAVSSIYNEWTSLNRDQAWAVEKVFPEDTLTSFLQLNYCAGKRKKIAQGIKRIKKETFLSERVVESAIDIATRYDAVLAEGEQLHNAMTAAKSRVVKGRIIDPTKVADPADLYNTAHCAICDRRQKIKGDVMVHHGFEISGGSGRYYGCRIGSCFGVGYKPYEFGCDANIAYKPILEAALVEAGKSLAYLNSGTIAQFTRPSRWRNDPEVVFHRDVEDEKYEFKRMLEHAIYQTEREIEHLKEAIRRQTEKIEKWVLRPLPPGSVPPSV